VLPACEGGGCRLGSAQDKTESEEAVFHQWITADDGKRDSCVRCGVVAPDENRHIVGKAGTVESSHGCVPLTCPGPDAPSRPHEFSLLRPWTRHYTYLDAVTGEQMLDVYGGWTVACDKCGYVAHERLLPSDFRWECLRVEHVEVVSGGRL
jgi:ribosomal protein S27AE